ncbi:MAG: 30S ribosomal protein S20 [Flavobacteriaceae bacterium]|nr:30S ribosomal protein S20 [Flavobacteriaceae bacterium]|tara:strand:+ start:2451 stop:2702 length:252 start_codon:yes stop_codon:yes gene_type:complete
MANHKSAIKRIRSSRKKRLINRFQSKTARNAIRKLRATTSNKEAKKQFPRVVSLIDKLAKKNIIHDNKASNLKSKLAKHMASL